MMNIVEVSSVSLAGTSGSDRLDELNAMSFGNSKNQKQIINKSNIPDLIKMIISNNQEYFDLKDNSIYLTNIVKIYQHKTKVLLEDVTGTILHLRNLFKSNNSLLGKNKAALTVAEATSNDVNKIIALKNGNLSKYLSNKTTLKLNKNNLVKDTLDTFSLFQYGDVDLSDANLLAGDGIEIGRKFDNNTQETNDYDYSVGDIELGRGLGNEEFADISGVNSLGSETNDPMMQNDRFGFHNDLDAFDDNADDEEGDFSLEAPRAIGEMEENNDLINMDLEIDELQLNLNTPPDSPRGKVTFDAPARNRFVKNHNLQPVIMESATEIPKRVFEQVLKDMNSSSEGQENNTNSGKVNKRFLEQLYSSYELQTLSLVSLRNKKQKPANDSFVNSSLVLDGDDGDESLGLDNDGGFGDVSLGLDNEQPILDDDQNETNNGLQLMDTHSENTFISVSSYLTSATPGMRAQREKDHIQQDMILSKTKNKTNFNDIFADENMNKKDISQLFLQVLNLSTESKIQVEQIGSEIFVYQ
ncbi:hypothetical protein QEN19_003653 [Hanseniaspora menglaensis]